MKTIKKVEEIKKSIDKISEDFKFSGKLKDKIMLLINDEFKEYNKSLPEKLKFLVEKLAIKMSEKSGDKFNYWINGENIRIYDRFNRYIEIKKPNNNFDEYVGERATIKGGSFTGLPSVSVEAFGITMLSRL